MPIPPTMRLFPELKSDLRAAGFAHRTANVHLRDVGRLREFVQFQRDRYSTPTHTGLLINVAAIDRQVWTQRRGEPGRDWMPPEPDSPDYAEGVDELGWIDRPDVDYLYFDSRALQDRDTDRVRTLLADGVAMLEQRRVTEWPRTRRPITGLP